MPKIVAIGRVCQSWDTAEFLASGGGGFLKDFVNASFQPLSTWRGAHSSTNETRVTYCMRQNEGGDGVVGAVLSLASENLQANNFLFEFVCKSP